MRAVLFCNEMLGLGHLGLSLAVAEELVAEPGDTALIVTGSPAFGGLRLPAGVDLLKLPTAPVDPDSAWNATGRKPASGLDLDSERITELRADLCRAAVERINPDVMLVDYRPFGRNRDLAPALDAANAGSRTVTALGIWDTDDAPAVLRSTWTEEYSREVAAHYDMAFVYGPPPEDDVRVSALSAAGVQVHETGFVSTPPAQRGPSDLQPGYLLVITGGGADGFPVVDAVLAALRLRPVDRQAIVVTGPLMPLSEVSGLRAASDGLDALIFESRPDIRELLAGASAVVSMAGYCSTAEILASGKPALLIPRAVPREEQLNRARRLAEAGLVLLLEPDGLTPEATRSAIDTLIEREPKPAAALSGAADVRKVLKAAIAAGT